MDDAVAADIAALERQPFLRAQTGAGGEDDEWTVRTDLGTSPSLGTSKFV